MYRTWAGSVSVYRPWAGSVRVYWPWAGSSVKDVMTACFDAIAVSLSLVCTGHGLHVSVTEFLLTETQR